MYRDNCRMVEAEVLVCMRFRWSLTWSLKLQDVLGLAKLKILGDKLNKRDRRKNRGHHSQVGSSLSCAYSCCKFKEHSFVL